jgi:hypothetical protein
LAKNPFTETKRGLKARHKKRRVGKEVLGGLKDSAAKAVCGRCSEPVSLSDDACPHCKAKFDKAEPGHLKGKDMSAYVHIERLEGELSTLSKTLSKIKAHPIARDVRFKIVEGHIRKMTKPLLGLKDLLLALTEKDVKK